MKVSRLEQMTRGWFVGDFAPTLHKTRDVEVAVMRYQAGDAEKMHYHKIATELTVVNQGEVEMNGRRYVAGDIIVMDFATSAFSVMPEDLEACWDAFQADANGLVNGDANFSYPWSR